MDDHTQYKLRLRAFSGGLLGVLLFLITPNSADAFQADSLVLSQNLTGLQNGGSRFGDYDGDGDLDLIFGGDDGVNRYTKLYKNNGNGTFTEHTGHSITNINFPSYAWGDMDGDGDLDLAMAGEIGSSNYIAKLYRNDGAGNFTEIAGDVLYDTYWGDMEWGDLDGDGDLDLLHNGLSVTEGRLTVIYWNDGTGVLTRDTNNTFTGTAAGDLTIADIDNDGDLDFVNNGYSAAQGTTEILKNNGSGVFTVNQTLDQLAGSGNDWSDFDNDGDLDFILMGTNYSQGGSKVTKLFLNDGNGYLTHDSQNNLFSYPVGEGKGKFGDLDNDGDVDIIMDGVTGYHLIYLNNGSNVIGGVASSLTYGTDVRALELADLDGDGFLDVFVMGKTPGGAFFSDVFINNRTKPTNAPSSPTNLNISTNGTETTFSWDASSDIEGGSLTYNAFVYSAAKQKYLIPPMGDTGSGFKALSGLGNQGLTRTFTLDSVGTSFNWGVQAIDAAGNSSPYSVITLIEPPSGLTSEVNGYTVNLIWNALQDSSIGSYRVYTTTDTTATPTLLATVTDTTHSLNLTQRGAVNYFAVSSVDTLGSESFKSAYVSAVIPPITVTIDTVYTTDFRTTISWDSVKVDDFKEFKVYQTTDTTGTDSLLATITDTTFTSQYLNRGSTTYFRISAVDSSDVESSPTKYVSVTIPSLEVTGLGLQEIGFTAKLTWDSVTVGDFSAFKVYQTTDTTGAKTILSTLTDTMYTTGQLSRGATYYFAISILDSTGTEGPLSDYTSMNIPELTPQGLALSLVGNTVKATWNQRTEGDVQSYKLYFTSDTTGTDSLLATITDTTFTTGELNRGTIYYFRVSTVDTTASESQKTAYTSISVPDIFSQNTSTGITFGFLVNDAAWGDYDNDGDLDLLFTSYSSGSFTPQTQLYDNDGDGTFTASGISLPNYLNGIVAFGDFDNDNDLDVFISGYNGSQSVASIYENTGGNFVLLTDQLTGLSSSTGGNAAWVDIDGDNDLDLIYTGNNSGYQTKVYRNNVSSGGGFTDLNFTVDPSITAYTIDVGDFDNDGDQDLVISGGSSMFPLGTKLYLNDGTGLFSDSEVDFGSIGGELNVSDYNNDSYPDILIAGYTSSSNSTRLFLNNGMGAFAQNESVQLAELYGHISSGDYDNDGDVDIILYGSTGFGAGFKLFDNDGSGSFTISNQPFTISGSVGTADLQFVDYDSDNDLDIVGLMYNTVASYTNNINPSSAKPSKPENVVFSTSEGVLTIGWQAPSNLSDGSISYNIFLKEKDSTKFMISPAVDTLTGYHKLNQAGNNQLKTSFSISLDSIQNKNLIFGVQAISASRVGGDFWIIDRVPRGAFFTANKTNFTGVKDSLFIISRSNFQLDEVFSDAEVDFYIKENATGNLFFDKNENGVLDAEEAMDSENKVKLSTLSIDSLLYNSASTGFEEITVYVEYKVIKDSVTLGFYIHETHPSISGTSDQGGWYLLSNPIDTTLGYTLKNIWTQGAINADAESGTPNIYTFNPDSASYVPITTDLDTSKAAAGEGILVYIFPDDDYNDATPPINGGWPKTLSNAGNPFGEDISIPVKNADVDGNGVTSGSEGFMLMGNPFGFEVSIDSIIAEMVKIDPYANRYVYRWDPINKQYNLNFNGSVDAYESFFVRTIQSGITGTALLDYNDVHSSARLKNTEREYPITLNLHHGENPVSSYSIRFNEGAKTGIDPLDGYYLGSFASSFSNLYSTVVDQPLTLNNLPMDLTEVVEIPLYLHTTEQGVFTLDWSLHALPETWSIELENPATGEIIDVRSEQSFSFNYSSPQLKRGVQKPALFAFLRDVKAKTVNTPELVVRINPGITTNSEGDLDLPTEVELYQNYPNPFNPSSTIRFGVPEQAPVQLEVFDILGRKVMTLLNGEMKQPGRYNINFDGRTLASGMYVYRLVIGDKVLSQKMTLIK